MCIRVDEVTALLLLRFLGEWDWGMALGQGLEMLMLMLMRYRSWFFFATEYRILCTYDLLLHDLDQNLSALVGQVGGCALHEHGCHV